MRTDVVLYDPDFNKEKVQLAMKWDDEERLLMQHVSYMVSTLNNLIKYSPEGKLMTIPNYSAVKDAGVEATLDTLLEECSRLWLPVEYYDGFPSVNGLPLWERLDGEKYEYYDLFKLYRDMYAQIGYRALIRVSELTGVDRAHLNILQKVFNWQLRAQAYDVWLQKFNDAKLRMKQEKVNSTQETLSTKILSKIQVLVEEANLVERMDPKDVIKLMSEAASIQRLSVGMPKDKLPTESSTKSQTNVQVNVNTGNSGDSDPYTDTPTNVLEENAAEIIAIMESVGAFDKEADDVEFDDVEEEKEDDKVVQERLNSLKTAADNKRGELEEHYEKQKAKNERGKK